MSWCRRRPALAFFLATMFFSWACWIPFAASRTGHLSFGIPAEIVWLGEFGPSIAALALTALLAGRRGLRERLRTLVRWRVRPGLYGVALGLTPAVVAASLGVDTLLYGAVHDGGALAGWDERFIARTAAFTPSIGLISGIVELLRLGPAATAAGLVMLAITNGGLSEEIGWRGWALASLRGSGRSPLVASLLVGWMWAAWHTSSPVWELILTRPWHEGLGAIAAIVLQYALLTVPLAVIYTVLVEASGGSLLIAVLLHASYNLTINLAASAWPGFPMVTMLVLLWLVAIALTLARRLWRAEPSPAPTTSVRPPRRSGIRG